MATRRIALVMGAVLLTAVPGCGKGPKRPSLQAPTTTSAPKPPPEKKYRGRTVSEWVAALSHADASERMEAIRLVTAIRSLEPKFGSQFTPEQTEASVTVLIHILRTDDLVNQAYAANAVRTFGLPAAKRAIPALEALEHIEAIGRQEEVRRALAELRPE